MRKPRVCFVSPYCYPLFNPEVQSPYGGSEVRIAAFARELAKRGAFDVHVIVLDHGQLPVEVRDGVTLHSRTGERPAVSSAGEPRRSWSQRLAEGNPLQRLAGKALAAALAVRRKIARSALDASPLAGRVAGWPIPAASQVVLARPDADIYVVPGNSSVGAETLFFCRGQRKAYVFLAGSDGDFHRGYLEKPDAVGIYGYPGALMVANIKGADAHVVQSEAQADLLQRQYARTARIVRNPIALGQGFPRVTPRTILWIGKSDWIKRPELFLDLARRVPDHPFVLVMTLSDPALHARIEKEAASLPNVSVHTYVPFADVERLFAEARVFVSTSRFEGFPNTFLQAAKYGVPIVSLEVDPRGMLAKHGAGRVAGADSEKLLSDVRHLLDSASEWTAASEKASAYVRQFHDLEKVVGELEDVLFSLVPKSTVA